MRVQQIVEDPLMRHSAILVFANKQDLVSVSTSSPWRTLLSTLSEGASCEVLILAWAA